MSDTTKTEVESTKEVKGKLVMSLNYPSPVWATWAFRIVLVICTTASFIVAGDDMIPAPTKVRIMLYLNGVTGGIWTIARFLGIKKEDLQ